VDQVYLILSLAPIRKAPVRVVGNKENNINPSNQWGMMPPKSNNNFDDK
jgi:hypothetical protein